MGFLGFIVEHVGLEHFSSLRIVSHSPFQRSVYEFEQFVVVFIGDEGAFVFSPLQSGEQLVDRSVEKHGGAVGVHPFHVVEEAGSSSSSRHEHILKFAHFMEHGTLDVTESVFSSFGE